MKMQNGNDNNDNNLCCFTVGRRKSEPSVSRLRQVSSFHSCICIFTENRY